MADYAYGATDELENAELKKLNAEVFANPDDYEGWQKLVSGAESLEGGLNRNSSPQSIAAARDIYDRFLAKFPLFFGYWKKYADLEFAIAGTEAAEMIYERGVACIGTSVDLWANYCAFKVETNHDQDVIRELFERGAASVGLDFLAHPFWDKYVEFEERFDAQDKVFAILNRVIAIPLHQYARYFEKFRIMAATRPLVELADPQTLAAIQSDLDNELAGRNDLEIDRALRTRLDNHHLATYNHTQAEVTKRWTYEGTINRPYFHVTELEESQLDNWNKYLDFEELEGDYARTAFLYERCVVTCAHYEEFWLRYARWMYAQDGHEEETRNIFARASCQYVAIAKPEIRIMWALFEETSGRPTIAAEIYDAILYALPSHLEAVVGLANLQRRQYGYDAAVKVYQNYIQSPECSSDTKGALVAEMARLAYKTKSNAEEARNIFKKELHNYLDSQPFWTAYLKFEMDQPTTEETATQQYQRIKAVHDQIRQNSRLLPEIVRELSQQYMSYLTERSDKAAAKEYMDLDAEVNGPASIIPIMRAKIMVADKNASNIPAPGVTANGHAVTS